MIKYNCVEPQIKMNAFCQLPFQRLRISHLGGVTQCCYQGRDIANIFENGVLECWKNETAKKIQNSTLNNELHQICKGWGGCPYIGKDLSEAVKTFNTHKNFDYPIGLEIELPPTQCNIGGESPSDSNPACIMCPRNSEKFRSQLFFKESRYWEVVEKVKFLMPYLQQFTILGVAEPFWKNAIFETMDIMDFKSHQEHCQFWTFTNGTLLNKKNVEKYMEYVKYSLLNISLDAGTPKTYKKIRRLDLYNAIKKNVIHYSSIKDKSKHFIKICHNINKINLEEMPLMVKEAKSMGANSIFFNPTHTAGGYNDLEEIGLTINDVKRFSEIQKKTKNIALKIGIEIESFRELELSIHSAMPREKQLIQLNIP